MNKTLLDRYELAHTIKKGMKDNQLVRNDTLCPHWMTYDDGADSPYCWYRRMTATGREYRLLDAVTVSNELAFDHQILASTLTEALSHAADDKPSADNGNATEQIIDPLDLPLSCVNLTVAKKGAPLQLYFKAFKKHWHFDSENSALKEVDTPPIGVLSPNGKKTAFHRDHNIWIKDLSSGEEQPLTQDGIEDSRYGEPLLLPYILDALLWSADSRYILFAHLDRREARLQRHVNYVPTDGSLYPEYTEIRLPISDDKHHDSYSLLSADTHTGDVKKADYPPIPMLMCGTHAQGFLMSGLAWWSTDNQRVFFIDAPVDRKTVRVVEWNTQSGDIRVVFEETDEITVRLRHELMEMPIFTPLPETDELIWFSERSGWGHLYLYDLKTGQLKHQITGIPENEAGSNGEEPSATNGEWLVRNILHVDTQRRELLVQTAARDPNISAYYRDICKVNIDSGQLTPLISGNYEHVVREGLDPNGSSYTLMSNDLDLSRPRKRTHGVSPSGHYIITTRSRVDTVPESVLIDRDGREISTVETADVSGLPAGWQWPEPVKLKAADGKTDIEAVVFRPPGFSPDQSYPVIDFVSSTRDLNHLSLSAFTDSAFWGAGHFHAAATAALGFVVVMIAGRGTPLRDKAFYTHHFGDHAFNSDLNDRIAGIRQLVERYPYMDLERVGITGNENPVQNTIYASLLHSDFYKVSVITCMPDPRFISSLFSGPTNAPMPKGASPKTPYPEDCVESFSGKLLLVQGIGLWGIPSPAFLLVNALIKANKDVDMLCVPNLQHSYNAYTLRREWDYLVTHLMGCEPPPQFHLTVL